MNEYRMYHKIVIIMLSLGWIAFTTFAGTPRESNMDVKKIKVFDNTSITDAKRKPIVIPDKRKYFDVVHVVDGDTIVIDMGDKGGEVKVRILGINSPESVDPRRPVQCYGIEASKYAKKLLEGRSVRIEFDSTEPKYDKYGRMLGYIYRDDGLNFNDTMVKTGYAYEYTYRGFYDMQAMLQASEKKAREKQLGLWSPKTCSGVDKKWPKAKKKK